MSLQNHDQNSLQRPPPPSLPSNEPLLSLIISGDRNFLPLNAPFPSSENPGDGPYLVLQRISFLHNQVFHLDNVGWIQ